MGDASPDFLVAIDGKTETFSNGHTWFISCHIRQLQAGEALWEPFIPAQKDQSEGALASLRFPVSAFQEKREQRNESSFRESCLAVLVSAEC